MRSRSNLFLGSAFLLSATMMYSLFGIFSRLIGFDLPLVYQTGLRGILAGTIAAIILNKRWVAVKGRDWSWFAFRGVMGLLGFLCFFVGVNYLTIGMVYFMLYFGSTVGGYFIGALFFQERITKIKWISLGLSILGLWLIYLFDLKAVKLFYVWIALLSGIFTAIWNSLVKKIPDRYPALQMSMLDSLFGGAVGLTLSIFVGENWVMPVLSLPWIASFGLAALYILTDILVVMGFRRVDVQVGSLVMLSEVLFGLLLGYFLYGEMISKISVLGGGLIVLGIVLPEVLRPKN